MVFLVVKSLYMDRGEEIGYTEDGVMQLDLCVETREEAIDMIGRQRVIAVMER